jgi:DNA-binding response OmpR family regulator
MSNETLAPVLIVDDDERLAKIIQFILKRAGLEAEAVYSGEAALSWLKYHTASAVILDLMMPDISGFSFLRELRAQEATQHLPVIVLTARADQASRLRSESLGANDFLVKPVNSETLTQHLRQAIAQAATPKTVG